MKNLKRNAADYNQLAKEINKNFIIRLKFDDKKKGRLIGGGQLKKFLGEENALRAFLKALNSETCVYTIKVRSLLKIQFVSK